MPVFNQNHRTSNELNKFLDDGDGNPAIRVSLKEIRMSEDSVLEVFDHRGFLIFKIDEATGDIYHKGGFIKL